MTTLQIATLVTAEPEDTREAQEARWIAWKRKAAADDRLTRRRVRIAFAVVVIVFVCVTLAVLL